MFCKKIQKFNIVDVNSEFQYINVNMFSLLPLYFK